MEFITDFHLHSRFSRACSKKLTLANNAAWAQIKGIDLLTTADFTHPAWFKELHEQLEQTAPGIYKLKEQFKNNTPVLAPPSCNRPMHFFFTTEISLIYKKADKVRRIHHILMAPNIETAARINIELEKRGNIRSDGRPILGLDSKELLKILLDISKDIQLIPAHVWTPHFAIFGSNSGFDSVEECFEELSDHICALETGLSSDPAMNYRISKLDKYILVSSSDAHSSEKFGREATIFDTEMTYPALLKALRQDHHKIKGTIEFFPQEGKYHCDGLRDEGLCLQPDQTKKYNYCSPQSGRKITVGVLHRIDTLADQPLGRKSPHAKNVWHIIPLQEILAEILQSTTASKKVVAFYFELINKLGPEFYILKDCPISDLESINHFLAEAIRRMRAGQIIIKPGYDGEYGIIKLFQPQELLSARQSAQAALF